MSDDPEGGGVAQADDGSVAQADDGGATQEGGDGVITQEDMDETAKKIKGISKHTEQPDNLQSYFQTRPKFGDADHVEVDRTNLEAILDVANRLKTKRSRKSTSILALASETYKDKQVNKTQWSHLFSFVLFVALELIWECL